MQLEEIFRFLNVRPVQKASEQDVQKRFALYNAVQKSPFHQKVEQLTGADARDKAVELGRQTLPLSSAERTQLTDLLNAVRRATAKSRVGDAKKEFEKAMGMTPSAYLRGDAAQRLRDALWDRVYAHALVPEEQPSERELVVEGVRAFHYLERLTKQQDDDRSLSASQLSAVTPSVPRGVIPPAPPVDTTRQRRDSESALQQLQEVHGRVQSLRAAMEDLKGTDRTYKGRQLRAILDQPTISRPELHPVSTVPLTGPSLDFRPDVSLVPRELDVAVAAVAEPGLSRKLVVVPKKVPWHFDEFGQQNLRQSTRELLEERKSGLAELELMETLEALEQEKTGVVTGFLKSLPTAALEVVRARTEFKDLLQEVAIPGYTITPALPAPAPGSAAARGIQPLGMGDLLVVKQELLRYTAGEVAHIENVLKSEFKTRTHNRMREVEEIVITETENLEETEKDLQTTERFELQKETQKTIENEMSLDAGLSVTASYGPVSLTAHADFALSQSSSESNRTASSFARQITERSVSRIMQRTREERTRRTLERFEEKNEHGFDNKEGNEHVIGVYRWVDKHYQARLINYGRRLMMEFIIPEPAAFYLHVYLNQAPKGITLEKPVPPMASGRPLEPTDLTKWNFQDYVAQYNVQDAEPYPAEVVRISAAFAEAAGSKENMDLAKTSEKLTIPKGYKCYDVFGQIGWQGYGNNYFLECFIAGQRWGSVTAAGVEGIIPISIKGWCSAFHVNIVAMCELTAEAKAAWQLKTYASIMTAYERALSAYNEQVSAAQIQAGVDIQGRNPELNRKLEKDELKKGALRLLTNNFAMTRVGGVWRINETFNAMKANGQFGYPEFDVNEALVEGRIIQFFEQAFEWTNMTYRFYPYSWGRKSGWKDTFPLTDTDPQFADFLRAGSARVIIPVTLAYAEAVLHYLWTNEIWNGGSPPTLYDPLFVSIVDELKADAGAELDTDLPACAADSGYPCVADTWQVKLPTTLVYLQKEAELPDFT